MKKFVFTLTIACCFLALALVPAQADTFNLTSCHLSNGCGTATQFGTVTLTQVGNNVQFDIVLNSGNRFVETGAGGDSLFVFNDTANNTITNITTTLGGVTVSVIPGGVSGATGVSPFQADGTGMWTAQVFCTVQSDCNGGSTPTFDDLHFTVNGTTVGALETDNTNGNMFVADILCGQTGCTGLTGPIDVSTPPINQTPEPASLALFGTGLFSIAGVLRRKIKK
jgi:hypothetical protein